MTSCTIIISHFESLPFLNACLRQIKKYTHPEIIQKIIICDQSRNNYDLSFEPDVFNLNDEITILKTKPFYSGYGIDCAIRELNIDTDYICQIHVDAFPIHINWLYLPIKLIEENNMSFVGQLQFISKVTDTIYPPNNFFAMAQCFNVARTETYKEMSMEAGFTRYHQRATLDMKFNNDDWAQWAKDDYINKGSDDDVVAFHWHGKYKTDDMLGLAITGFCQAHWGRIIEDIVFHFGSCRESIGTGDAMGDQYATYTKRINENYDDALIDEMVELAKANRPPSMEILSRNYWDGTLKKSFPPTDELNKRIEELKK